MGNSMPRSPFMMMRRREGSCLFGLMNHPLKQIISRKDGLEFREFQGVYGFINQENSWFNGQWKNLNNYVLTPSTGLSKFLKHVNFFKLMVSQHHRLMLKFHLK